MNKLEASSVKYHTELSPPLQTENGHHTDNNSRPRVSEWEVIQESGMKLKAVFGSGYTGIKNLGNTCYLGTVMQVLFSIPDFQRMWVHVDKTLLPISFTLIIYHSIWRHVNSILVTLSINTNWKGEYNLISLAVFSFLLYSTEYCLFDT